MLPCEEFKSTLLEYVVARLKTMQEKEYMTLWRETGIPYFWTRKVANGEIKNPGVDRIEFLYTYFSGKQINP